jgi:hypothetical protein
MRTTLRQQLHMHTANGSNINSGDSIVAAPPNNRMQRGGLYKVLGRGQMNAVLKQVPRARVPTLLWPRADAGRSATSASRCFSGVNASF